MTLGEFLSAHSPLSSGTVIEHLQALQIGGGGPATTVFVSNLAVRTEHTRAVSSLDRGDTEQLTVLFGGVQQSVLTPRKEADHVYAYVCAKRLDTVVPSSNRIHARRVTAVQYSKKG